MDDEKGLCKMGWTDGYSANNYYPFGMLMPRRSFQLGNYRYGFNGQEKTDEISGSGNHIDFNYRGYDPRTGRFWSVDPLFKSYPWNSTYAFAENDVIRCMDLEGREKSIVIYDFSSGKMTKTKIELETAGKLGNGVAVQLIKNGTTTNFYGKDVKTAEQFTRSYEGLSESRYNDQYGNPTIGYGHLITKNEEKTYPESSSITTEQANTLFSTDYSSHKSAILENLDGIDLNQNQQDALVDFGYNTGASKVKKFTSEKGEGFFLDYMKGGAGIQKRRIGEALLFSEVQYLHFDKIGNKKNNTYLNQLIKDNTKTETPAPSSTGGSCDDECTN